MSAPGRGVGVCMVSRDEVDNLEPLVLFHFWVWAAFCRRALTFPPRLAHRLRRAC